MEIFIDGQKIDITLDSERTVGDVLTGIEQHCARQNATIVEIEIDGENVPASAIDAQSARLVDGARVIKLNTITASDIAAALKNLTREFSRLEQELPQIPLRLQSGRREESLAAIQRLADVMDEFCRLTSLCALFPAFFEAFKIDGGTPRDFLGGLSPVLNDFCSAMENNDIVMMGDLAEYEICPRISALDAAVKELP
jgi:hypothetical protein